MGERKTLKISPKIYDMLEQHKRDTETWNSFFERLVEAEATEIPLFRYEVTDDEEYVTLKLRPRDEADIFIKHEGGAPRLHVDDTTMTNASFRPALEDIHGVEYGKMKPSEEFEIRLSRDMDADVSEVIDEVFNTIQRLIDTQGDFAKGVEQEAAKYAVSKDRQ